MDMTTTANALQYEHDNLAPDREHSFADVVYLLTTPPPDTDLKKTWNLSSRGSSYIALFAYSLAHPQQFVLWANDAYQISKTIKNATYADVHWQWAGAAKSKAVHAICVAALFLFAPRSPKARARDVVSRPVSVHSPPEDGTVRVKWYPNLETTKHWPAGIGELWTDAPVDCDGSVDLKAVMRRWGMQNCYVIDANRTRPQLWRHPVEKLSALAISVLLADGHKVIGVVECPSEHLQVARKYRAYLKHQPRLCLMPAFRVLWRALRPLADTAFNLAVYGPRFLWFFVCSSPYILFHALEIAFLVFFALGTVVVHDLEDLGHVVQDFLVPHACAVLGATQVWLVAGLEAAFLTDKEIRRCMMQRRAPMHRCV